MRLRALPFACALLALAALSTAQTPLFSVPDAPAPQELGSGRPLVVDLDGDGDQDVVLEVADGFRIWHMDAASRRYREVQFLEQGRASAPGFSRTVLVDLDGDGHTDLLTGDLDPAGFAVRAYVNDRAGRFAPSTNVSLPTGEFALPLALHDLDLDGSPEVFAATETRRVVVWTRSGSGSWVDYPLTLPALRWQDSSDPEPLRGVLAFDLDEDGDLDLIGADAADPGRVLYALNDGQGGFPTTEVAYPPISGQWQGDPPMPSGPLIPLGAYRSSSPFDWPVNVEVAGGPEGSALLGWNGSGFDGRRAGFSSTVYAESADRSVSVFSSPDEGRIFARGQRLATPPFRDPVVADLDADGDPDALVSSLGESTFAVRDRMTRSVVVYLTDPDGRLAEVRDRNRLPGAETVATGSMRAPGSRDLVLLRSDDFHDLARVRQMLVFDRIDPQGNRGPLVPDLGAGFRSLRTLQLSFCQSIDLDSDGRDELLVDGYESLGNQHGFLVDAVAPSSFPNTFLATPHWPSDLDHDGDLDLIGVGSTRENRNGVWEVSDRWLPAGGFGAALVAVGDLDGDGRDDAVTASGGIWLRRGATFELLASVPPPPGVDPLVRDFPRDVHRCLIADLDGDGDGDVVGRSLLFNDGTTFRYAALPDLVAVDPNAHYQLCLGDFDEDGDVDIVRGEGRVQVLRNDGAGGFVDATTAVAPYVERFGLARGTLLDADLDGDLDLVLSVPPSRLFSGWPFPGEVEGTRIVPNRIRHLSADRLPTLGSTWSLRLDALANPQFERAATLVIGLRPQAPQSVPGLHGELLVDLQQADLRTATLPAGTTDLPWQLPIPDLTSLLGLRVHCQAAVFDMAGGSGFTNVVESRLLER